VSYLNRMPQVLREADNFSFVTDFITLDATNDFATTFSTTGTATIAGIGGILSLLTAASAPATNDEAYLSNKLAAFKPQAKKPSYFEALAQFTEGSVNNANVAVGLASSISTGLLQAASGGIRASGAFIGFFKKGGENAWRFHSRNGSTFNETLSLTPSGLAAYQRLDFQVLDGMGQVATIVPRIDGALMRDSVNPQLPVKHLLDLTSLPALFAVVAVKAGAANAETLNVDYLAAVQLR